MAHGPAGCGWTLPPTALAKCAGPAVVPGKGAESILIEALRRRQGRPTHAQNRPPLPEAEIKLIPDLGYYWARLSRPPVRPAVPKVSRPGWASNAIDFFIQALYKLRPVCRLRRNQIGAP